MEGVGSRLGRSSSRYGPSATTVFNGPVRKWKKKWVHVSPTTSTTGNRHNSHSNSRFNNNSSSSNSRLVLCRWTPLSSSASTAAAGVDNSASPEEPPKRKFRYTPIGVLEEKRKAAKKDENESNEGVTNQLTPMETPKNDSDSETKTENQDSNMSNLDLGLCLKGHNNDHDSADESNGGQVKKSSSGGFWTPS
ncbi:uncharacterized protein LOC126669053 [Mercurialis annua]|uniref:uncharacterized protein LOC126669053 n=1 Tax=Mercurialis annua TaxID=3986 RepID=UPI002160C9F8|nr:uncharacterized protein LOC126669053 [Mercurialis annua]